MLEGFEDGEGDRDWEPEEPQGFRARLTSLPDMERALDGRATGSGAFVSGYLTGGFGDAPEGSEAAVSLRSSADRVNREMATADFSLFLRREVRRRMSFPAATSSFDGEAESFGNVRSENVLRKPGDPGSETGMSERLL